MNARNPSSTGKGPHNPCGPKDRQPAFNPKPGVPCLKRNFCTPWHRNCDFNIPRNAKLLRHLLDNTTHHFARHWVNRRLTHTNGQPRLGHCPNALPSLAPLLVETRATISAPWVTSGSSPASLVIPKHRGFSTWQSNPHLTRKSIPPQRHQPRFYSGGRAGACGPTTAQISCRFACHPRDYRRENS